MSLGSAEPTAPSLSSGTRFRHWLRSSFRNYLGVSLIVCCMTGGAAICGGAWAALPGTGLPEVTQPGAGAPISSPTTGHIPPRAVAAEEPSANSLNVCERAGVAMEQASGLPAGLLLAIGRVESGRWDSGRGRVTAWPWTINAGGKGLWFSNKEDAAQTVRDLLDGGMHSIDVGCFQINLLWHPTAFANIEQAFDPEANAAYAARFLLALFSQTGSWEGAVEAYHSADPQLGFAYRQQVFSSWAAAPAITADPAFRRRATSIISVASRPIAMPVVIAGVQIWTPMPRGSAAGVVAMPGSAVTEPLRTANGATQPLPVVLYQVMPPELRAALRSARQPAHATGVALEAARRSP